jgi:uncharacterized protein YpmS
MSTWALIFLVLLGIAIITSVTAVCILFIPKKNKEHIRKPIQRQVNERPRCPCQNRSR